jgi:hypothetical protein
VLFTFNKTHAAPVLTVLTDRSLVHPVLSCLGKTCDVLFSSCISTSLLIEIRRRSTKNEYQRKEAVEERQRHIRMKKKIQEQVHLKHNKDSVYFQKLNQEVLKTLEVINSILYYHEVTK